MTLASVMGQLHFLGDQLWNLGTKSLAHDLGFRSMPSGYSVCMGARLFQWQVTLLVSSGMLQPGLAQLHLFGLRMHNGRGLGGRMAWTLYKLQL